MATTAAGEEVQPSGRAHWTRHGAALEVCGVAVLTLIGFVVRIVCFDQSLFGDELFLYVIVHDQPLGQVLSVVHDTEKTPPLGFVLSWISEHWGGPELVRLPSFLASVATVPLLYLLGRRVFGIAAAFVAAAWFAISPFEIFYGTEARSYAVVAALVLLSTLALLTALREPRRLWWALYVVAAAAALYTHYIAALTLVPQAAWALWVRRDRWREQLTANAIVVVAFLPWVPFFATQFDHSSKEGEYLSRVVPLTASQVGEISAKALIAHPFVSMTDLPGSPAVALLAAALMAALASLAYSALSGPRFSRPSLSSPPALMVVLAVVPLVGLVLYSARPNTSFLLSRNLSVAAPYALLVIAWLLTRPRGVAGWVLPAAALVALGVGMVQMLTPAYQRPPTRKAAQYIDAHAEPRASVVDVQLLARFHRPPARAMRIYLQRLYRVFPGPRWVEAWEAAYRERRAVLVSFPDTGVQRLLVPPRPYAARYRLAGEQAWDGAPYGMAVRAYVPR